MKRRWSTTILILVALTTALAQTKQLRGAESFPELEFAKIKGAPTLSQPFLLKGTAKPIYSEGNGLAAPAFFDWDGDGLKDLLIGEFGSGVENGRYVGNFIRVYRNTGTESQPEFTGAFDYARHPFETPGNGSPYSVDQFCCMGFTPQFIDLNADGKKDMISGQYYGEVTWFQAAEGGFMPGEFLDQAPYENGLPRHEPNEKHARKAHQYYWLYSSANLGDFTGDNKPDLVVGGTMAMRMSVNIGTATKPTFAQRELLLDINGNPLKVYTYNKEELKAYEERAFLGYKAPVAGDSHLTPFVADWDGDGQLDLLVTNSYVHQGLSIVDFFKGRGTNEGYRFEPAVPLFTAKTKSFPGSSPRLAVVDWNNDGVNDLLIGVSVVTTRGEFNDVLSWNWEADTQLRGVGKDPANLQSELDEKALNSYKQSVKLPAGISMEDYMTLRHQGYVYVMLGTHISEPVKSKKAKDEKKKGK